MGAFSFPNVMDGFVIDLHSFRHLLIDLTFDHLNQLGPRLAKLKEQGYLTTIDIPALPAPQDDNDIED